MIKMILAVGLLAIGNELISLAVLCALSVNVVYRLLNRAVYGGFSA